MWSEVSWSGHSPDADRSRRWAPHPDRDASEYRQSSGGGGCPEGRLLEQVVPHQPPRHVPVHLPGPGYRKVWGIGLGGTSDATGGSASGVSREVPASPTMTCVPTTPATVGPGALLGLGTLLPRRGISVCGPRWGMLGQTPCLQSCRGIRWTWTGRGRTSPCLSLCRGSGKARGVSRRVVLSLSLRWTRSASHPGIVAGGFLEREPKKKPPRKLS